MNKCKYLLLLFLIACHLDKKLELNNSTTRRVSCKENAYHIQNICEDEKEYLDWAAKYPKLRQASQLNRSSLQSLTKNTLDVDKATAIFYHRIIQEPLNKEFLNYVEKKELEFIKTIPDYNKENVLLAIVPGMFYKDNPNVGADGKKIRDIAKSIGLQEDLIPVKQTGTLQENADIICNYVKNRNDVKGIILASVSKGSSDVKIALKKCGKESYFKKVRAWYNIGGLNKGTKGVKVVTDDFWKRNEGRFYFWTHGYNWQGFLDMSSEEGKPLSEDLQKPEHILLVNIIGTPLFRHVSKRAKPFYLHLVQYGPNDGITLLADSYIPGSVTYCSWRNDHYFLWPIAVQRIQAIFSYIMQKQFCQGKESCQVNKKISSGKEKINES